LGVWGVVLVACVCVSVSGVLFSVGVCGGGGMYLFLQKQRNKALTLAHAQPILYK